MEVPRSLQALQADPNRNSLQLLFRCLSPITGEATATATVHAAKAATSAADAASAAASAAAEDSGRQQQQQEGLVQAGQAAAGAMRQVAAGTSAAVGTATAEFKDILQEGLEVAKGAVDNVAGAQASRICFE